MDLLKAKERKMFEFYENMIKETLDHLEFISPNANYAWLETHMPPAKWKEYLYHWKKAKENLELNLLEIKDYLKNF